MKTIQSVIILSVCFIMGCFNNVKYEAYPLKSEFSMTPVDYPKEVNVDTALLSHVIPFARSEIKGRTVLFGFMSNNYNIKGQAYLMDENQNVIDTLVVCYHGDMEDWEGAEIGKDQITKYIKHVDREEDNGVVVRQADDTLRYTIESDKFVLVPAK